MSICLGHLGEDQVSELSCQVSWIRWQGRLLGRHGKPKQVVRVNWEHLAKELVRRVFKSHLWMNFLLITGEIEKMESEKVMLKASTVEAAPRSCGHWCLLWWQPKNSLLDTSDEGGHQAEKGLSG